MYRILACTRCLSSQLKQFGWGCRLPHCATLTWRSRCFSCWHCSWSDACTGCGGALCSARISPSQTWHGWDREITSWNFEAHKFSSKFDEKFTQKNSLSNSHRNTSRCQLLRISCQSVFESMMKFHYSRYLYIKTTIERFTLPQLTHEAELQYIRHHTHPDLFDNNTSYFQTPILKSSMRFTRSWRRRGNGK